MTDLKRLLSRAFPLMAITGLLLVGYGLIVTPDDIKSDASATYASSSSLQQ